MRQPQNAKRGRGRGRRGSGSGQPHVPNRNTSYESNGPDVKLRGNAQQLYEKYTALAHDASSSAERISAEAYSQFADHYFRLHQAALGAAEMRRQNDGTGDQLGHQRNKAQPDAVDAEVKASEVAPKVEKTEVADGKSTKDDEIKNSTTKDGADVVKLSSAEPTDSAQGEQDSASA